MSETAASGSDSTRQRLIASAEELFARQGIDNTSLREVARHAGARNVVATQYHFGDRQGVIDAILDKHRPGIELERHRMLDRYETQTESGLHGLAAILVHPFAAKLSDPDGGPEFLQIYTDLLNRPVPIIEAGVLEDARTSLFRWRNFTNPLIDQDAVVLHRRFTAITITISELGRRARATERTDQRLFVSTLTDHVASILATTASPETRALLTQRDQQRP